MIRSRPDRSYASRWRSNTRPFSRSCGALSMKPRIRVGSPSRAPSAAKCSPSSVFPVPKLPAASVTVPSGRPPCSSVSSGGLRNAARRVDQTGSDGCTQDSKRRQSWMPSAPTDVRMEAQRAAVRRAASGPEADADPDRCAAPGAARPGRPRLPARPARPGPARRPPSAPASSPRVARAWCPGGRGSGRRPGRPDRRGAGRAHGSRPARPAARRACEPSRGPRLRRRPARLAADRAGSRSGSPCRPAPDRRSVASARAAAVCRVSPRSQSGRGRARRGPLGGT